MGGINVKQTLFTLLMAVLLLNLLLIFFGIYSYFFSVNDHTLIAGIIAFFGSVFGGIVTLAGVLITLKSQKNSIEKKEREQAFIFLKQLIKFMISYRKIIEDLNENEFERQKAKLHESIEDFEKIYINYYKVLSGCSFDFIFIVETMKEYLEMAKSENEVERIKNNYEIINHNYKDMQDYIGMNKR